MENRWKPYPEAFDHAHLNIPYARDGADRAVGDLYLPRGGFRGDPALLIHGGGWNSLSKDGFVFLLPIFALAGRPVFSINYRYISMAPWPACLEDTLAAAHFVLDGHLESYGLPKPEKILVCGASAGGHLAMMTGLELPANQVEGIISMAGPSRLELMERRDPLQQHRGLLQMMFGGPPTPQQLAEASPHEKVAQINGTPPPLFAIHSKNDLLVAPEDSEIVVHAWQKAGGCARLELIDGEGDLHGFWVNNDRESAVLSPDVTSFFARTFNYLTPTK
jgi:acetyl esterase/lipase